MKEKMMTKTPKSATGSDGFAATFAEVWDIYHRLHVIPHVVAVERLDFAAANLLPHFGPMKVAKIRQDDVQSYIRKRHAGKIGRKSSDATIRRELNAMTAAINFCAVKERCIPIGDIPYIPMPKVAPPKDVWLKKPELEDFIQRIRALHPEGRLSRIYRFVMIASQTAARRASIAELKWSQIDLEHRIIKFNPDGRVQTAKRRPVVPISDALLEVLKRAYNERISDYVLDHSGDVAKLFDRAAEAVGYPHVTPHVLRHTWATHAAIAGVDTWKIAGVLGDNEATVRRNYLHYNPEYLRDAVNA